MIRAFGAHCQASTWWHRLTTERKIVGRSIVVAKSCKALAHHSMRYIGLVQA
jgi:hypothetical protein